MFLMLVSKMLCENFYFYLLFIIIKKLHKLCLYFYNYSFISNFYFLKLLFFKTMSVLAQNNYLPIFILYFYLFYMYCFHNKKTCTIYWNLCRIFFAICELRPGKSLTMLEIRKLRPVIF